MFPQSPLGLCCRGVSPAPVAVQAQGDYLDVYTVKVKPKKLADFKHSPRSGLTPIAATMGDRWLALETVYGEGNVYLFTSTRKDYADVGTTEAAAMLAQTKPSARKTGSENGQDSH